MLNRQEVAYDFQYYTTQFSADLPVMVFSERKSLLNVHLPVFDSLKIIFKSIFSVRCKNPIGMRPRCGESYWEFFWSCESLLEKRRGCQQNQSISQCCAARKLWDSRWNANGLLLYNFKNIIFMCWTLQKVQQDFVEMRQKDKNFKGDDLHFILNLAR
jgi:hypothetical protein